MPSVVTFWWFPEEEESFLAFLETTGQVMALPFLGVEKKEELVARPLREYIAKDDPSQCFFFLADLSQNVVIESYDFVDGDKTGERFRAVDMNSCIIGYDRGTLLDSNKLSASNLYAYWEYPNPSGTSFVAKPPGFLKWAKKIFGWIRKATPDWHQYKNYRVSNSVNQAILNNGLRVVPY